MSNDRRYGYRIPLEMFLNEYVHYRAYRASWVPLSIMLAIAGCGDRHVESPDASHAIDPGWGSDVRLTNAPGSSEMTFNFAHSVAVGGDGAVHVVWFDDRDGVSQIYYKRSIDGGTSWDADRRLVADDTARMNPAVAAAGDTVYVSWHEVRANNSYHVVVDRSLDAGATWDPPVMLTTTRASAMTSIAADGDTAHMVWHETPCVSVVVARSA